MRWQIIALTISVLLSCKTAPPHSKQEQLPFVPYSIVTKQSFVPETILPLFNESIPFIEQVDSNAPIEVQYVNLDEDTAEEMMVKLLDDKNHIYKYYFLNKQEEKWSHVNQIIYCCEGLADTLPPAIDKDHRIIWLKERVWGSELEGYISLGLRLNGEVFDTVAVLPGVMYESFIPADQDSFIYTGHLFREWFTINDTIITLEVLCNINKPLTPESNFYLNTFSQRYTYQMYYDSAKRKYICRERMNDVRFPPMYASDIVNYEELKTGRKLLK